MEDQTNDIYNMLLWLLQSLVDRPEDVLLWRVADGDTTLFRAACHHDDVGKLIGKHGRTAKALRVILAANGVRLKKSFALEIIDPTRSGTTHLV